MKARTFWLVGWGEFFWSLPALNADGSTWVRLWTDAMQFSSEDQAAHVARSILPSDNPRSAKVYRMEIP